MESMWNPWNECWLRPQPISYSMDIMNSTWNEDGMVTEQSIPYGFHMDSTGFHMECKHIHLAFHETVHMESMEQIQLHDNSAEIPEKPSYLVNKNSSIMKNQTLDSMRDHVIISQNTLSAILCRHW